MQVRAPMSDIGTESETTAISVRQATNVVFRSAKGDKVSGKALAAGVLPVESLLTKPVANAIPLKSLSIRYTLRDRQILPGHERFGSPPWKVRGSQG